MRKNVASQVVGAQMITAADGSAFTGSVTVYVTGDGVTQAAGSVGSGACTHEGNGFYTYLPAQAETNYDHVAFTFIGSGAVPVTVQVYTGYPQTGDAYGRIGAPVGASISADIAVVDGNVDSILTDTSTTLPATLATIDGIVDDILDDTGTSGVLVSSGTGTGQISVTSGIVGSDIVSISGDATAADNCELMFDGTGYAGGTTALQVALTTSGVNAIADQVWDENVTDHYTANSAGAMLQPLHSGSCQAGGNSTTVVLASSANATTDDYYKDDLIVGWVTADGTNRFADYISAYTASTRTATVTGIPVSPDATYTYVVVPGGSIPGATAPSAGDVAAAVWNEAMATYTTEGTFGNAALGEISHEGTLQSAASTSSVVLDATGSSSTNNVYRYQKFEIVAGTGAGQSSYISSYLGSSKTATLDPALAVLPDNTSRYIIRKLGIDASTPANVAAAVWDTTRTEHASAGTFGEYVFSDLKKVSTSTTAADNIELAFNGTGYAGGTTKQQVVLSDGAHGGTAATLTLKKAVISTSTAGESAVAITASGTGNAHGVAITASGGGKGVAIGAASVGVSIDSSAADAVTIQGGTDSDGMQIAGNGAGVGIRTDITADITGTITSAGSVTGDVGGNVVGDVQGNVDGSVASVTGAVGSVAGNVDGSVASVTGDVGGNVVGDVQGNVDGSVASVTAGVALTTGGIDALFTRQLTEAYAADGAAPTVAQALFMIQQMLGDFEISGTTLTVKKLNGSTTAATYTLNDGTTPTGITRSG